MGKRPRRGEKMKTIEMNQFQAMMLIKSIDEAVYEIDENGKKHTVTFPAYGLEIIIKPVRKLNTPSKTPSGAKCAKTAKTESRQKTTKVSENEAKVQKHNPHKNKNLNKLPILIPKYLAKDL
jgi:hypothetical protein